MDQESLAIAASLGNNYIRQKLKEMDLLYYKMECIFCKGEAKQQEVEHKEYGISLGKFPGFVCSQCEEVFFTGEGVDKIQQKSKAGLFGLSRKVKVGKFGDSLMVRIPKEIANFVKLKEGKEVRISPEERKIIIEH